MTKQVLILAALVLVPLGCGGDDGGAESPEAQPPAASAEVPFDQAFIDAMVPHHREAIEMPSSRR
jgi:uncharacterized protein (DUF305 family)